MKYRSKKQSAKNRELSKIKAKMENKCVICGNIGSDLAHLLPKSTYPEHYTEPKNLVIMCRDCHNLYDNDLNFRRKQVSLYNQICEFDLVGGAKYFRIYDN